MFNAETIMNREVVTVNVNTPIYEAMRRLVEYEVSGLPVVDDQLNLEGIITEKDVLGTLLDKDVNEQQTVADYMTKDVNTFSPEDPIETICEFLMRNPYRRVPIVRERKLLGIIARRDIIAFILKLRAKNKQSV